METKDPDPKIKVAFSPLSTSLGVGLRYDKRDKVRYTLRGKKSFCVTNDDSMNFVVKGRYDVDQEFKGRKSEGAAEFTCKILDFQRDQDVRLKAGYEGFEKVQYLQIRENNWTLSADMNGRWNVRFCGICNVGLINMYNNQFDSGGTDVALLRLISH
ncbi:hypothetical protein GQ457_12G014940 [Hibiscus cannabinus]